MSAAISKPLPPLRNDSLRAQAQSKASNTHTIKPSPSSIRTIKRKPVPAIPAELLSLISTPSEPEPKSTLAKEKQLDAPIVTDITAVKKTAPSASSTPKASQQAQHQYVLKIDAPVSIEDSRGAADDTVRQLVRSASVTPASTSSLSRTAGLGRKNSITAQFKNVLRRNRAAESAKPAELAISGPSNFVHLATGTGSESTPSSSEASSMRRSSTMSRASMQSMLRSSISSLNSVASSTINEERTLPAAESYSEDKPLYTLLGDKQQPLRPKRSIRRPAAAVEASIPQTSARDKRKAIYASPGSAAAMLEPIDVGSRANAAGAKLNPILASATSPAGESFAATLDRTLGRAHAGGALTPEPELGYESSSGASNRSSLASLNEFKSIFEFPMERTGSKGPLERDIWAALDANTSLVPPPISKV